MNPMARSRAFLAAILLVAACTPLPPKPATVPPPVKPPSGPEAALYQEVAFDTLPGWAQASLAQSLRAFLVGCGRPPRPLLVACELAALVPQQDEAAARQFFESRFAAYALRSSVSGDSGLLTGYYEPVIEGARTRDAVNRFPIYGVPEDLIVVDLGTVTPEVRGLRLRGRLDGRRLVPYYSRGEIEDRALGCCGGDVRDGGLRAPVLGWAADPVDLFFLQIQGSGQLQLPGGERVRLGYADQNGHPFRSLGRYLVERGEMTLDQASMQNIKAWAAANPQKLREALNANPSYVFFRELNLKEDEGPIGALSVPLTGGYSLAVDRRFVPLGAPVYVATTFPLSEERLERLMAAQDTGGAIRGVVRGDFYWGSGPEAGAQAGRMRNPVKMWLLWPRGDPLPRLE
jgi:membrane-bound lytic murein transglycosylase A